MANWLTYRIRVGDDVLVLADEEAQELIKNETERSKKADAQIASFLESTTTNGIIRNSKSDPFGQTAIGGMKVVIDKGDLIIKGNIKNHARLTRTYNVTQENRTEVFLYRFDSVTNEITGLWRDCIIQGDIILSREDKTELPLRSSGYYDMLICKVTIPAGATEITQDMIGDFRQNEYYCGYAKNLLVEIDETLTKSDAAADAAAVGTVIGDLRNETRTRDIITGKRITNLEAGLPAERWSVDDSVAYIKDVPENALPFASVDMVGGMTRKCANGLRSAPVTEVESVGVNLFDNISTKQHIERGFFDDNAVFKDSSTTGHTELKMRVESDTQYTIHGNALVSQTNTWRVHRIYFYDRNKNWISRTSVITTESYTFRTPIDCAYIDVQIAMYNDIVDYSTININKGKTALPYTPYRRNTLPVPAEVQALDGYGWGMSDKIYNYIDWKKKQFVKRVERVDLGTLNWGYSDGDKRFFVIPSDMAEVNSELIMRALCAEYLSISYNEFYTDMTRDKTICRYINYLFVRNLSYTDAATFKAAMSGVMLYYELATPVITDISDLLPDDNLIGVEGGGTVTTVNEYGYDVPSEITYQLKGAEA